MIKIQYIGDGHTSIALDKTRGEKTKVVNGEIIEIDETMYPTSRLLLAWFKIIDEDTVKDPVKNDDIAPETDEKVEEKPAKKGKKGKK